MVALLKPGARPPRPVASELTVPNDVPNPVLRPVPSPVPKPVPRPVPNPVPSPVPKPVPSPVPKPVPSPVPKPVPRPVPKPLPSVGMLNPKPVFVVLMKLLKPVPKLELNPFGDWPKPMKPLPKPLLKPLKKLLLVNGEPKRFVNGPVGSVKFGSPFAPTGGWRPRKLNSGVERPDRLLVNADCTAVLNRLGVAVVNGRFCRPVNRLLLGRPVTGLIPVPNRPDWSCGNRVDSPLGRAARVLPSWNAVSPSALRACWLKPLMAVGVGVVPLLNSVDWARVGMVFASEPSVLLNWPTSWLPMNW